MTARGDAAARLRERASTPSIGLGLLLRTADMTFNRALRDALAARGVTFSQFQHLRHLWDDNGLTQAELSRRIGIETPSSTSVLDSLDKAGLVRRERQPTDRRKINVYLTPAGKALREPLMACALAVNTDARFGLSAEEDRLVFEIVGKIVRNLQTRYAARERLTPAPADVPRHRRSRRTLTRTGTTG
jgi:DNA-binding MarR family transcriptional regulator